MQLVSIEAYLQRIPLKQAYSISYSTVSDTEIVYLEIKLANGITGYGASNPFADVVGETPEQTLSALRSDVVQEFIGRNIEDYRAIIQESYIRLPNLPGAQAALDIALHDAYGKCINQPVVAIYGRKITSLPTSITIGIKSISEMIEDAALYVSQGFRIIKLKTGISVEEDIERLIKMYERFGSMLTYRVDANLGYTIDHCATFLKHTSHIPIELIEQPLPVSDNNQLLQFDESIRNKFVADESLTNLSSAEKLVQDPKPFGVFNIKLMKAGGILAGKTIADLANQQAVSIFWGCNDESLISITAALHIAYACSNTKYLDLDGSIEVLETLFTGGFRIENGQMLLPDAAGLGVQKL